LLDVLDVLACEAPSLSLVQIDCEVQVHDMPSALCDACESL
jgi:hypothetical protein